MATKGSPRDGAGVRSRAQLEEEASEDATRTLNEREIRVARRREVLEQYERELEARLNAWQHSTAFREESET